MGLPHGQRIKCSGMHRHSACSTSSPRQVSLHLLPVDSPRPSHDPTGPLFPGAGRERVKEMGFGSGLDRYGSWKATASISQVRKRSMSRMCCRSTAPYKLRSLITQRRNLCCRLILRCLLVTTSVLFDTPSCYGPWPAESMLFLLTPHKHLLGPESWLSVPALACVVHVNPTHLRLLNCICISYDLSSNRASESSRKCYNGGPSSVEHMDIHLAHYTRTTDHHESIAFYIHPVFVF
jgi:hypothetical protein